MPAPHTSQLRRDRQSQGRTLRSVAREADVDPAFLSKIERGLVQPSIETFSRLLVVLGADDVAQTYRESQAFLTMMLTPTEADL